MSIVSNTICAIADIHCCFSSNIISCCATCFAQIEMFWYNVTIQRSHWAMLQLTASPWTTEASTSERWQFRALTNRKATSSNRAPSTSSLYYYSVALSFYRDKWTAIIRWWWLSQWLVTYGHKLVVTIYVHVAPSPCRHSYPHTCNDAVTSDGVSRLGLGLETCLETRFLESRSWSRSRTSQVSSWSRSRTISVSVSSPWSRDFAHELFVWVLCLLFCYCVIQGVSFNCHHRNVRSRVSVSVSNFQVSVSAFMTKSWSRSRSRLEIWAMSRSRRLRSRLHHWLLHT